MKIRWQVEDGYAGGGRPHWTEVPDEELAECETDEERERLIRECIQADFDQTISWYELEREEG